MPLTHRDAELARLDRLARLLDSKYKILGVRFGWDAILGLVPGIGDLATTVPAAVILHRAWKLGLPRRTLARMVVNVALDTVVGSIPILGSVFDIVFRANTRNITLIREHLQR